MIAFILFTAGLGYLALSNFGRKPLMKQEGKYSWSWISPQQIRLEQLHGSKHLNLDTAPFLAQKFYQVKPSYYMANNTFANRVRDNMNLFNSTDIRAHEQGVRASIQNLENIRKGPRGFSTEVRPFVKWG